MIALTFLLIGFQAALFLHKASVALIVSKRDRPDTVYVVAPSPSEKIGEEKAEEPVRKASDHKDAMKVVGIANNTYYKYKRELRTCN